MKGEKIECDKKLGWLVGVDTANKKTLLVRKKCKQWDCVGCAKINQKRWRAHLIDCVNNNPNALPNYYLVTITASAEDRTPLRTITDLKKHGNVIAQLFRDQCKRLGQSINYVRVFETHKDGAFHAHILLNTVLAGGHWYDARSKDFTRFKDYVAAKPGLGFMAEIKQVEHDELHHAGYVASYIAKYLTKQGQNFDVPKYTRRIATSRSWSMKEFEGKSDYVWNLQSTVEEFDLWWNYQQGHEIYDADNKQKITYDELDSQGILAL